MGKDSFQTLKNLDECLAEDHDFIFKTRQKLVSIQTTKLKIASTFKNNGRRLNEVTEVAVVERQFNSFLRY